MSERKYRSAIILGIAALAAALLALAATGISLLRLYPAATAGNAESVREAVAALEARGLWREALTELDRLRQEPGLSRSEQADLLYKMGNIADQNLADCERALGLYTMAKALSPQAGWVEEADKRSVYCMEKTGRGVQAQALLNQLTGAGGPVTGGPVTGQVVAVIDGRSVSWDQVQEALLLTVKPGDIGKPEVRQRMLGEYVFTYILALEAAKKGYDTEPLVTPAVEYARRQTIAALYLRRELKDSADVKAQNELAAKLLKDHAVRIFNEAIPAP
jgi:tetratricopeptide (TPR) repeat protein